MIDQTVKLLTKEQWDNYTEQYKEFLFNAGSKFMPNQYEKYWHVLPSGRWEQCIFDYNTSSAYADYYLGNCFRTEEEAVINKASIMTKYQNYKDTYNSRTTKKEYKTTFIMYECGDNAQKVFCEFFIINFSINNKGYQCVVEIRQNHPHSIYVRIEPSYAFAKEQLYVELPIQTIMLEPLEEDDYKKEMYTNVAHLISNIFTVNKDDVIKDLLEYARTKGESFE